MHVSPLCHRRTLLQLGAVSVLAGAAPTLAAPSPTRRACVFIMLQGGASHHDLWDPKPEASREISGPFESIATKTSGIRFGELLAETATISDKLCVIRSMTHNFNNHIAGTYIALTGSTNQSNNDREAHADDFPGPGAVLNYLQREIPKVPRSVSLPTWLSIPGPSNRMPGQYGGFLGSVNDPFLIEGDPNGKKYRPLSLEFNQGMTTQRLDERMNLSSRLDAAARLLEHDLDQRYNHLQKSAYDLVVDGRVRQALDIESESPAIRDRYGRTKIGQSLLVARRLIEAGVQFVAFNAFNQEWDTHGGLKGRYHQIVPPMDKAFAALVSDLDERGLLDSTLVVNTGEFGRTPRVNKDGGRDHWPNAYSLALAGGGVRGGIVHGATDHHGSEVLQSPVAPADVLATLWRQLGIDPATDLRDRLNRPMRLSNGRILHELLA